MSDAYGIPQTFNEGKLLQDYYDLKAKYSLLMAHARNALEIAQSCECECVICLCSNLVEMELGEAVEAE